MTKRTVVIGLLIAAVVAAVVLAVVLLYANKATVTINHENIVEIEVLEGDDLIATTSESPLDIRVDKGSTLIIKAKGKGGFSDTDEVVANVSDGQVISISPYYSQTRLDKMLAGEKKQINQLLIETHVNIFDEYSRKFETLYRFGDWYGLVLKRKPGWFEYGDDQRVVLQKKDGTWKIVAGPYLYLNKYSNSVVPIEIQDDLNEK